MVEKRFEKLGIPDIERFENYLPTAFNSELTLLQKVNKIIFDLIETNKLTNEMIDYLNKFIETFDEKLYKTVEDVLKVWLDDGVLADIVRDSINEEVIEARTDYLDHTYLNLKDRLDKENQEVTAQLAQTMSLLLDNAISPEQFEGNAIEKIQQALDFAVENDVGVKFSKIYDITGLGSLFINKANAFTTSDRRVLYLFGVGGGIRKNDGGKIFTTTGFITGDINVQGLKYFSVQSTGVIVWDCDKIIRVMSTNCTYNNVDCVASAPNLYFQSMRFLNEHITGGHGWAFEFKECFDVTLDVFIESREHGIRNTEGLPQIQNRALRINNVVIENLSGIAIQLGSCFASNISNGYFEHNLGGQIDLVTLDNHFQFGLRVEGNVFGMTDTQKTNNVASIKWGKIRQSNVSGSGAVSIGNASDGVLHEISSATPGYIVGQGDEGSKELVIGNKSRYVSLSNVFSKTYPDNSLAYKYGFTTTLQQKVSVTLTPSQTKTIIVPFEHGINDTDLFSVTTPNGYLLQVLSTQVPATGGKELSVWVKNLSDSESITRDITVTIIRLQGGVLL